MTKRAQISVPSHYLHSVKHGCDCLVGKVHKLTSLCKESYRCHKTNLIHFQVTLFKEELPMGSSRNKKQKQKKEQWLPLP